jgi:hypothetical protein
VPPAFALRNHGTPDDDGVTIVDLDTGKSRLIASIRKIVTDATPRMDLNRLSGDFYCMHVKWSPRGDRLLLVLRCLSDSGWNPQLVTLAPDGRDLRVAVSAEQWARGGNHPGWCPDGERILMNLDFDGAGRRFTAIRYDGSRRDGRAEREAGRGHPTLHPGQRFILTDAYPGEALAFGDGTAPVWLIDRSTGKRITVARVDATPPYPGPANQWRVDLHPAWDRTFRYIAFNGILDGIRRVFVADVAALLSSRDSGHCA